MYRQNTGIIQPHRVVIGNASVKGNKALSWDSRFRLSSPVLFFRMSVMESRNLARVLENEGRAGICASYSHSNT